MTLAERYRLAFREALEEVAEEELLAAARDEVPVMPPQDMHKGSGYPGQLRDSGRVEMRNVPGGFVAAVVFDTPYAKKQHEDRRLRHPHGGKAQYLADPQKALTPRLRAELARRVREKMAAGDA